MENVKSCASLLGGHFALEKIINTTRATDHITTKRPLLLTTTDSQLVFVNVLSFPPGVKRSQVRRAYRDGETLSSEREPGKGT